MRRREPGGENSNAASRGGRLALGTCHELGEEELAQARLRAQQGTQEHLGAVDLPKQDDALAVHALNEGRSLAAPPAGPTSRHGAHGRPGTPRAVCVRDEGLEGCEEPPRLRPSS
eukprot:1358693-Pyramimonas_sp.AAC.1